MMSTRKPKPRTVKKHAPSRPAARTPRASGAKRVPAPPASHDGDFHDVAADFEKTLAAAGNRHKNERYVLRLYITGTTPRSTAAIANIRRLCDTYLAGRYDLEVIDVYQQPVLAQGDQIIAAPTLIKKLPFPLRKVVGDLSNEARVLMGLDIRPRTHS
jgi:circadian clock protein KaiB